MKTHRPSFWFIKTIAGSQTINFLWDIEMWGPLTFSLEEGTLGCCEVLFSDKTPQGNQCCSLVLSTRSWKHSTEVEVLALHIAGPSLIPNTTKSDPWARVKSKLRFLSSSSGLLGTQPAYYLLTDIPITCDTGKLTDTGQAQGQGMKMTHQKAHITW